LWKSVDFCDVFDATLERSVDDRLSNVLFGILFLRLKQGDLVMTAIKFYSLVKIY
jgi:hypothetical protein